MIKILFAHTCQKIADGCILPQLDKGVDLPGLPAHPEIQLVQHVKITKMLRHAGAATS